MHITYQMFKGKFKPDCNFDLHKVAILADKLYCSIIIYKDFLDMFFATERLRFNYNLNTVLEKIIGTVNSHRTTENIIASIAYVLQNECHLKLHNEGKEYLKYYFAEELLESSLDDPELRALIVDEFVMAILYLQNQNLDPAFIFLQEHDLDNISNFYKNIAEEDEQCCSFMRNFFKP